MPPLDKPVNPQAEQQADRTRRGFRVKESDLITSVPGQIGANVVQGVSGATAQGFKELGAAVEGVGTLGGPDLNDTSWRGRAYDGWVEAGAQRSRDSVLTALRNTVAHAEADELASVNSNFEQVFQDDFLARRDTEMEDNWAVGVAQWIYNRSHDLQNITRRALPLRHEDTQKWWQQVSRGVGFMAPMVATSYFSGGLGGLAHAARYRAALKAAGASGASRKTIEAALTAQKNLQVIRRRYGYTGATGFGVAFHVGEAGQRAAEAGLTGDEINMARLAGVIPGATEAVPVSRLTSKAGAPIFDTLFKPSVRARTGAFMRGLRRKRVSGALVEGFEQAAEETVQGGIGALLQNTIEHGYDPRQSLFHEVHNEAALEGAVGLIYGLAIGAVRGRGGQPGQPARTSAQQPAEPPAEQAPEEPAEGPTQGTPEVRQIDLNEPAEEAATQEEAQETEENQYDPAEGSAWWDLPPELQAVHRKLEEITQDTGDVMGRVYLKTIPQQALRNDFMHWFMNRIMVGYAGEAGRSMADTNTPLMPLVEYIGIQLEEVKSVGALGGSEQGLALVHQLSDHLQAFIKHELPEQGAPPLFQAIYDDVRSLGAGHSEADILDILSVLAVQKALPGEVDGLVGAFNAVRARQDVPPEARRRMSLLLTSMSYAGLTAPPDLFHGLVDRHDLLVRGFGAPSGLVADVLRNVWHAIQAYNGTPEDLARRRQMREAAEKPKIDPPFGGLLTGPSETHAEDEHARDSKDLVEDNGELEPGQTTTGEPGGGSGGQGTGRTTDGEPGAPTAGEPETPDSETPGSELEAGKTTTGEPGSGGGKRGKSKIRVGNTEVKVDTDENTETEGLVVRRPWEAGKKEREVGDKPSKTVPTASVGVANRMPKNTMAAVFLHMMQSKRSVANVHTDAVVFATGPDGQIVPEHRDMVSLAAQSGQWVADGDMKPKAETLELEASTLATLNAVKLDTDWAAKSQRALLRRAEANVYKAMLGMPNNIVWGQAEGNIYDSYPDWYKELDNKWSSHMPGVGAGFRTGHSVEIRSQEEIKELVDRLFPQYKDTKWEEIDALDRDALEYELKERIVRPEAFDPRFASEEARWIPSLYTLRQFYRDVTAQLEKQSKNSTEEDPFILSHLEKTYLGFGDPSRVDVIMALPDSMWTDEAWAEIDSWHGHVDLPSAKAEGETSTRSNRVYDRVEAVKRVYTRQIDFERLRGKLKDSVRVQSSRPGGFRSNASDPALIRVEGQDALLRGWKLRWFRSLEEGESAYLAAEATDQADAAELWDKNKDMDGFLADMESGNQYLSAHFMKADGDPSTLQIRYDVRKQSPEMLKLKVDPLSRLVTAAIEEVPEPDSAGPAYVWSQKHRGMHVSTEWINKLPPEDVINTQEKVKAMRKRWGLTGINVGGYMSKADKKLHLSGMNHSMKLMSKAFKAMGIDVPDKELGKGLVVAAGKTGRGAQGAIVAAAHFANEYDEDMRGSHPTINMTRHAGLLGSFAHEMGHRFDLTARDAYHAGRHLYRLAALPYWRQAQEALSLYRHDLDMIRAQIVSSDVPLDDLFDKLYKRMEPPKDMRSEYNAAGAAGRERGRERRREWQEQIRERMERMHKHLASGDVKNVTMALAGYDLEGLKWIQQGLMGLLEPVEALNQVYASASTGGGFDTQAGLAAGRFFPRYIEERHLYPRTYYKTPTEINARSFERVILEVIREYMPEELDHPLAGYLINSLRVEDAGTGTPEDTYRTAYPSDMQYLKDMRPAWKAALETYFDINRQRDTLHVDLPPKAGNVIHEWDTLASEGPMKLLRRHSAHGRLRRGPMELPKDHDVRMVALEKFVNENALYTAEMSQDELTSFMGTDFEPSTRRTKSSAGREEPVVHVSKQGKVSVVSGGDYISRAITWGHKRFGLSKRVIVLDERYSSEQVEQAIADGTATENRDLRTTIVEGEFSGALAAAREELEAKGLSAWLKAGGNNEGGVASGFWDPKRRDDMWDGALFQTGERRARNLVEVNFGHGTSDMAFYLPDNTDADAAREVNELSGLEGQYMSQVAMAGDVLDIMEKHLRPVLEKGEYPGPLVDFVRSPEQNGSNSSSDGWGKGDGKGKKRTGDGGGWRGGDGTGDSDPDGQDSGGDSGGDEDGAAAPLPPELPESTKKYIGDITGLGSAGSSGGIQNFFANVEPDVIRRVGVEGQSEDGTATLTGIPGYEFLRENQLEGVDRILHAFYSEKHRGFILADTMGTGKTAQAFATAKYTIQEEAKAGRRAKIAMLFPNNVVGSQSLTQAREMLGMDEPVPGLEEGTNPVTYMDLIEVESHTKLNAKSEAKRNLRYPPAEYDLLVFDEAHNLKNADSQQAQTGIEWGRQAKHVLLMSGTPSDKPSGLLYLVSMLGEEVDLRRLGVGRVKSRSGGTTYDIVIPHKRFITHVQAWVQEIASRGQYLRRVKPLDIGLSVAQQWTKDKPMQVVMDHLEDSLEDSFLNFSRPHPKTGESKAVDARMMPVAKDLDRRNILELMNYDAVIQETSDALKDGRKPIIMLTRASETMSLRLSHDAALEEIMASALPGYTRLNNQWVMVDTLYSRLRKTFEAEGLKVSFFMTDEIKEKSNAMKGKTQSERQSKARAELVRQFQDNETEVFVSTQALAAEGISLDDVVGDRSRVMLLPSISYAGDKFVQLMGRIDRMNTKSTGEVKYMVPVTGLPTFDQFIQRAIQILAEKNAALNATGPFVLPDEETGRIDPAEGTMGYTVDASINVPFVDDGMAAGRVEKYYVHRLGLAAWRRLQARGVHIVETYDDLPADVRRQLNKGTNTVTSGVRVVDTRANEDYVYLVADQFEDFNQAWATLLHELGSHAGLDRILGPKIRFLADIVRRSKDPVARATVAQVKRLYRDVHPAAVDREIVANIVTVWARHSLIKRWWADLIYAAKRLLRTMGFGVDLVVSDIRKLLEEMVRVYASKTPPKGLLDGGFNYAYGEDSKDKQFYEAAPQGAASKHPIWKRLANLRERTFHENIVRRRHALGTDYVVPVGKGWSVNSDGVFVHTGWVLEPDQKPPANGVYSGQDHQRQLMLLLDLARERVSGDWATVAFADRDRKFYMEAFQTWLGVGSIRLRRVDDVWHMSFRNSPLDIQASAALQPGSERRGGAPGFNRRDILATEFLDSNHPLHVVTRLLKRQGLRSTVDLHDEKAAMPSVIKHKQFAAKTAYVDPLNKELAHAIREVGIPIEDIVHYRFLKGAMEYFARENKPPKLVGGMSFPDVLGALNELQSRIQRYNPEGPAAVERVMDKWTALTDATLDIALQGGMYGEIEVQHLKDTYRYYAPFIFEDAESGGRPEPALSVFHASDPDDFLTNLMGSKRPISMAKLLPSSVTQLYKAIESAENNRGLLRLAHANQVLEKHDKAASQVQVVPLGDPKLDWDNPSTPEELFNWRRQALRERGGKPVVYFRRGRPYAMAFRNDYMQQIYITAAQAPAPTMEAIYNVLNIPAVMFRKGVTTFSGDFFARESILNPTQQLLSSNHVHLPEIEGKPISRAEAAARAGKLLPVLTKAYGKHLLGTLPVDSPHADIIRRFEQSGGKMHFVGALNSFQNITGAARPVDDAQAIKDLVEEVQELTDPDGEMSELKHLRKNAWRFTKDKLETIENGLAMVDNIGRLTFFAAWTSMGVPDRVAGASARQLMDLSQSGTVVQRWPILALIYPFISVAMTGAQVGTKWALHPKTRWFLGSMVALGVMGYLLLDDDDRELLDNMSPYYTQTRVILPFGEGLFGLPLPHALAPYNAVGQEIGKIITGRSSVVDASASVLYSALTHYTPFNWSKTALKEGKVQDIFWDLTLPEVYTELYHRAYVPARKLSEVGSEDVSASWEFGKNLMLNAVPAADRYAHRLNALLSGNYDKLAEHYQFSGVFYRKGDHITWTNEVRTASDWYNKATEALTLSKRFVSEDDALTLIDAVNGFTRNTRPPYNTENLTKVSRQLRRLLSSRDWGSANRMAEAVSDMATILVQNDGVFGYDPEKTSATPDRITLRWENTQFKHDQAGQGHPDLPYDTHAHNTRYVTAETIKDLKDGSWRGVRYAPTRSNVYAATGISQQNLNWARDLLVNNESSLPGGERQRALRDILEAELASRTLWEERGEPAYEAHMRLRIDP